MRPAPARGPNGRPAQSAYDPTISHLSISQTKILKDQVARTYDVPRSQLSPSGISKRKLRAERGALTPAESTRFSGHCSVELRRLGPLLPSRNLQDRQQAVPGVCFTGFELDLHCGADIRGFFILVSRRGESNPKQDAG